MRPISVRKILAVPTFGAVLAGLPSSASADEAQDVQALQQRIERLEAQMADLQRRTAAPAERPPSHGKPDPANEQARITAAPGKGFTVTSRDARFSANIWSRIQMRNTMVVTDQKTTQEAQIRTFRLKASGHVLDEKLRYNTQLAFGGNDYEKDSSSPLFDAWVESTHMRDLNVRAGQFFVPLDRARTIREYSLQLVDRPDVVRELNLDRDVGVMLSSRDLGGTKVLGYELFVGGGEGRNRFGGQKPGALWVGRVTVRPWGVFDDDMEGDLSREARPRLVVGVGVGRNWASVRQKSTFGNTLTTGHAGYKHGAVDLVFKYAGVSLLAEGIVRQATKDSLTATIGGKSVTERTRSGAGYVVQSGVMVHAKVEVAGRWEQLFAAAGTDPDLKNTVDARGKVVGGGVNLYVNGHLFKVQSDYGYAFGKDSSKAAHTARFQIDASF